MKLFTFWSYAPLTYIERLCLNSMLAAGHAVDLYTYDDGLDDVPTGVNVCDASQIVPVDSMPSLNSVRAQSFSDAFRYKGLQRGLGTWVDMDVVFLRNISDLGNRIFGLADKYIVNGAILALPPASTFFSYIDSLVQADTPIPEHWPWHKKMIQKIRGAARCPQKIENMRGAVIGPHALTHYVHANDLLRFAQPVDVFYPVHWREAAIVFDPAIRIENRFTNRTRAVHLWNGKLWQFKKSLPPPDSYIGRLCKQFN
jgi:alpha 1,4-glycosyltransferase